MKCRYGKCKLGGEVEKGDATYYNKMYFHEECYNKYKTKEELRAILGKFSASEINIALSKAIDENNYSLGYIKFVAKNKLSEFKNAYGLLYQLKIEQNYKDFQQSEGLRYKILINQAVKNMDLSTNDIEFNYKPSKHKKLSIY